MRTLRLAYLLGVLLVVGCSVSAQEQPEPIGRNTLTAPTSTAPVKLSPVTEQGSVCFLRHGRLYWVARDVPYGSPLSGALASLAAGPTAQEALLGIRTSLPVGTSGPAARSQGSLALVDVPRGFDDLAAREQVLAVAQLTYTVTTIPGITALQLTVGGAPVSMPVANGGHGGLVPGPVTRANFLELAPR